MTIHLPGRAAPAPEISPELSRILADQAERDAAEVALHARNKEVLLDGLRLVGIAHVLVSFDGSGDSGQIESIDARSDTDQGVTLPAAMEPEMAPAATRPCSPRPSANCRPASGMPRGKRSPRCWKSRTV